MHFEFSIEELHTRGGILDKFMDTAFDAAIIVDRKGIIIHNSNGAVKLVNKPREDVIGKHISYIDPLSPFDRVIQAGKAEMGFMVIVTGRKCMTNIIPIISKGEIIGALGMVLFRSLTNLKKILSSLNETEQNGLSNIYDIIARIDSSYTFNDFIGKSKSVIEMLNLCRRAAKTSYPILIFGETGTGKEILANAFHSENLNNSFTHFVKINCTAIPNELLESELFGHEKGAFTGAVAVKKGKFELASGGSILLDEIGDMDMRLQGKLLRVLEEKEYERIGGTKVLPLNARIIASSNRDLKELCRQGTFRSDLYYRLGIVEIKVPPLRNRKDDIPLLIDHLMEISGINLKLHTDALELLIRYDWPGNVRELRNIIHRLSLIKESSKEITSEEIMHILYENQELKYGEYLREIEFAMPGNIKKEYSAEMLEKNHILYILKTCNYNITETARQLDICRATLYNKIHKYNLSLNKSMLENI